MGEHQVMFMLKLDGLTVKLTYEGGKLVRRPPGADGDVGEIVTTTPAPSAEFRPVSNTKIVWWSPARRSSAQRL